MPHPSELSHCPVAVLNGVLRELSADYGLADSQDAVVELAIERLYQEALDRVEAERWTAAAASPAFVEEMCGVAADLDIDGLWPA